jgi:hypothetical protein
MMQEKSPTTVWQQEVGLYESNVFNTKHLKFMTIFLKKPSRKASKFLLGCKIFALIVIMGSCSKNEINPHTDQNIINRVVWDVSTPLEKQRLNEIKRKFGYDNAPLDYSKPVLRFNSFEEFNEFFNNLDKQDTEFKSAPSARVKGLGGTLPEVTVKAKREEEAAPADTGSSGGSGGSGSTGGNGSNGGSGTAGGSGSSSGSGGGKSGASGKAGTGDNKPRPVNVRSTANFENLGPSSLKFHLTVNFVTLNGKITNVTGISLTPYGYSLGQINVTISNISSDANGNITWSALITTQYQVEGGTNLGNYYTYMELDFTYNTGTGNVKAVTKSSGGYER